MIGELAESVFQLAAKLFTNWTEDIRAFLDERFVKDFDTEKAAVMCPDGVS